MILSEPRIYVRTHGIIYTDDYIEMGIPKLTSFIKDYFAYWEERRVRGKLVVDGNNVLHSLHGGCEWS